jgi:hypothetical protein
MIGSNSQVQLVIGKLLKIAKDFKCFPELNLEIVQQPLHDLLFSVAKKGSHNEHENMNTEKKGTFFTRFVRLPRLKMLN